MKFFVRAILFLLLALPAMAHAQTSPKLGHVDIQKLMEQMPQVTKLQKDLDSIRNSYAETLKEMETRFRKLEAEVNSKEFQAYPEAKKRVILADAQNLQERIVGFERDAQEDMANETEKRLTPIRDKVMNAIKTVAKENNYAYIFNGNQGVLLYAQETDDVMPLVKKKLGLR